MLPALLVLALQGAALLALLAATAMAYYMLHDPAVRRAGAIAKDAAQPEGLPIIGHLLTVLVPAGTAHTSGCPRATTCYLLTGGQAGYVPSVVSWARVNVGRCCMEALDSGFWSYTTRDTQTHNTRTRQI